MATLKSKKILACPLLRLGRRLHVAALVALVAGLSLFFFWDARPNATTLAADAGPILKWEYSFLPGSVTGFAYVNGSPALGSDGKIYVTTRKGLVSNLVGFTTDGIPALASSFQAAPWPDLNPDGTTFTISGNTILAFSADGSQKWGSPLAARSPALL